MSYIIVITRSDIPLDDNIAWEHVRQLNKNDSGKPSKDFIFLLKKLMERYPCICDEQEDDDRDFIWSDGPLLNNAGENITILGLSSDIDEAMPFIVKTANSMGFVVFDEQEGKIYRPGKGASTP